MCVLPLPHAWFEAATALPERRFPPARALRDGLSPLTVFAARMARHRGETAAAPVETTLDSAQQSFDGYFDVSRGGGAPDLLRTAIAEVAEKAAADAAAGTELSAEDLATLARGLHRLADWVLAAPELPEEIAAPAAPSPDAMRRWKDQHQLFFVIIHGMLYLLHVLEEALERR
ncbi:MAG: hypothetical protein AAFW69_04105, partial [Pseudomonadota bacterium]